MCMSCICRGTHALPTSQCLGKIALSSFSDSLAFQVVFLSLRLSGWLVALLLNLPSSCSLLHVPLLTGKVLVLPLTVMVMLKMCTFFSFWLQKLFFFKMLYGILDCFRNLIQVEAELWECWAFFFFCKFSLLLTLFFFLQSCSFGRLSAGSS